MTASEAFLADIVANPADDGLRLIYADWLEDNGQTDRAEFIRVQIERVRIRNLHPPADDEDRRIIRGFALYKRELELLPRMTGSAWLLACTDIWYTRGFVYRVRLKCQDWLEHGVILVRQHPLERVELEIEPIEDSDSVNGYLFQWSEIPDLPPNCLPEWLWEEIAVTYGSSFETPEDAKGALSATCLEWARRQP